MKRSRPAEDEKALDYDERTNGDISYLDDESMEEGGEEVVVAPEPRESNHLKIAIPNPGDCHRCSGLRLLGPQRLAEFLQAIPKTDLHVHLDGSIRLSTLIELAKKHEIELPAYTEEGLRATVFKDNYENLHEYLRGFAYICRVMQTPEAFERIGYEFAVDNYSEGVHYFEVRFAPQLLATKVDDIDIVTVLRYVDEGLRRATEEFNSREEVLKGLVPPYRYAIIVCAMRKFLADFSLYYKEFCSIHKYEPPGRHYQLASLALVHAAIAAKRDYNLPIVAIDIAGEEAGYPAAEYRDAFQLASKNFLFKTCHAGEAWGPEAIYQAITDLHTERIGHGYHIFSVAECKKDVKDPQSFVDGLVEYVAKQRIMLEVCLTSNRQTMPELRDDLSAHAFKDMLAHGLCVSLNTDNRLVSNTTVCKELGLAVELFDITPTELKTIVLEGFKRSFFPGSYLEKREFVRKIISRYEHIEREFGLDDYFMTLSPSSRSSADNSQATMSCHHMEGGPAPGHGMSPQWLAHTRHHHHRQLPPEVIL